MTLCFISRSFLKRSITNIGDSFKVFPRIDLINSHIGCDHTNYFIQIVPKRCAGHYPKPIKRVLSVTDSTKEKFIYLKSMQRIRRNRSCYYAYEHMVNQIPMEDFFTDFDMPDTYSSWFTILELHVYLLCARLMHDRDHGLVLRNEVIEAMWNDSLVRLEYLDEMIFDKYKYRDMLSSQFQAALIGYDEGVQGSDIELAAALWRRFFVFNCDDAEKLERLVKYIRVQLDYLSSIAVSDIIFQQKFSWIPLKDIQADRIE